MQLLLRTYVLLALVIAQPNRHFGCSSTSLVLTRDFQINYLWLFFIKYTSRTSHLIRTGIHVYEFGLVLVS